LNDKYTTLLIKVKDNGDTIGLKEDIAMRLAGVMDIERIDVAEDAAEVNHGEWKYLDCFEAGYEVKCTNCGAEFTFPRDMLIPEKCPKCNAIME
jgi:hypothetical protein